MVNASIGPPVEKETIEQAIASCGGNIPKAALLEISPQSSHLSQETELGRG
ncbi:helix-turn-helix domain-containing protein [Aeromonas bestiarum]|uniref:helix-turn-helix domain-containing protein n=1 Tax=Aeromonas bestiarum TaxID=105751 RepID=UPI001FD49E21|nr:helix-turn-helix domain-containing protein [Aeromonas bestiarum]